MISFRIFYRPFSGAIFFLSLSRMLLPFTVHDISRPRRGATFTTQRPRFCCYVTLRIAVNLALGTRLYVPRLAPGWRMRMIGQEGHDGPLILSPPATFATRCIYSSNMRLLLILQPLKALASSGLLIII